MSMHNLMEYSDNCSQISGSLRQYYRDELVLNNTGCIVYFPDDTVRVSFKFKQKITGQTGNDGAEDVERMVPLKHLTDFWRTLKMPLTNCEINLFLTCLENFLTVARSC